jgi:hypothetical protein
MSAYELMQRMRSIGSTPSPHTGTSLCRMSTLPGLRSREAVRLRAEDLERVSEHRAEEPVLVLDVDLAVAVGQSLSESLGR